MKKKLKQVAELENQEQESDFSAISSKLDIKEPTKRKMKDVHRDFKEGNIILQPEFQRDFIWTKNKQAELIKSIWRGIPLPMFYFSVERNGKFEVIDGQQRLTTIFGYISSQLIKDRRIRDKLIKKIKIKDENKNNISRDDIIKRVLEDTNIYCVEIPEVGLNTNDKFEIFRSLNLGATPLKFQEIRNAIFQKEIPHLNKSLKSGAQKIERLTGMKNFRMTFEDLVLRFYIINEKGYDKRVSDQLKNNVELKNIFTEEKIKTINSKFNRFINYMNKVFGRKSFQTLSKIRENKQLPDNKWEKHAFSAKINQGLFHLFSYYIPKYSKHRLNKKSDKKIREEFVKLLKNSRFLNLITGSGTDSTKNIKKSSSLFEKLFLNVCFGDWYKIDKRNIPRELKTTMIENVPFCYLCYGKLKRIEHIENFSDIHGEHIKSFKEGNKSTYRNILLAHKKCNSEKSAKRLEDYRKQDKSILKRKKNKQNIKEYIRCLKEWNTYYPLHAYKKLVKYAKRDKKL